MTTDKCSISRKSDAAIQSRNGWRVALKPREHGFRRYPLFAIILSLLSAIASPAFAVTSGSPYTGIVDRNVFGLRPPTPVAPPTAPEPPPGNITLTGITTILGNKRALLKVSTPPRPPEPAKDENLMLTEGQRDGAVEVLEINEKAGSVKVNNAGQIATLTFEKNGAKSVGTALGPGPTGIPTTLSRQSMSSLGSRSVNSAHSTANGSGSSSQGPQSQDAGTAANQNSPSEALRVAMQNQVRNITPEEQTLIIEAQRMHLQDQGHHEEAAMFPPTELSMPEPPKDGASPF